MSNEYSESDRLTGFGDYGAFGNGAPSCPPGTVFNPGTSLCVPTGQMLASNIPANLTQRITGPSASPMTTSYGPTLAAHVSGFDIRAWWAARSTLAKAAVVAGGLGVTGLVAWAFLSDKKMGEAMVTNPPRRRRRRK